MTHSETPTLIREEKNTLVTDCIFVEDIQRILNVSERTVYRWTKEGILPYSKPTGGRLYFSRTDVDNLIRSRMTDNTIRSKPKQDQRESLQ